jgi:hypothetical protein
VPLVSGQLRDGDINESLWKRYSCAETNCSDIWIATDQYHLTIIVQQDRRWLERAQTVAGITGLLFILLSYIVRFQVH